MRARSNKCDRPVRVAASQSVDHKEVASDMALAMVGPLALERVIQPLWPKRRIVCDEQHHDFLQLSQVVAA